MTSPVTAEDRGARPAGATASATPATAPATPATTRDGPLVAVCGLAGGAGTTTLAHLLALRAARRSCGPVLLCDTGGPAAGLAAQTGWSSRLSLPFASTALASGAPPAGLFVSGEECLRLIAAPPEDLEEFDPGGLAELLAQARAAHELTVIDCGTLQRAIEREVARAASRTVWVTSASIIAVCRAGAALRSLSAFGGERQVLVARVGSEIPGALTRELMRVADERRVPLVLWPELGGDDVSAEAALDRSATVLEAISGALR